MTKLYRGMRLVTYHGGAPFVRGTLSDDGRPGMYAILWEPVLDHPVIASCPHGPWTTSYTESHILRKIQEGEWEVDDVTNVVTVSEGGNR